MAADAAAATPARYRRPELPLKTCIACGRPFAWRKKWHGVWGEVTTCSDRCQAETLKPK